MTLKRRLVAWLLPPCVLFLVHGLGIWVWFHQDDLTLLWQVQLPSSQFWALLFEPRAQGTYRPLSEHLFFYWFHGWFGLDAFPYRLAVFSTQVINLWLLTSIVRRISGRQSVGVLAASFWAAHHGLAVTMSWSSAYNQALSALFMLLGFQLFLKFADDKKTHVLYALQWIVFLVGFGALENVVVYPILLLMWASLFRRDCIPWAAVMLLGSAALTWFQLSGPSGGRSDVYALVFKPSGLYETLTHYVQNALSGRRDGWVAIAVGLPVAAGSLYEFSRGRAAALFGWTWFMVGLLPFLPLSRHISDYYLFFPSAGLALAVAAVADESWRRGLLPRAGAVAVLVLWTSSTVEYAREIVGFNFRNSEKAKNLVGDLLLARTQAPNKTFLLTGVDEAFFSVSIYYDVLLVSGVFDTYLAPDANLIERQRAGRSINRFFLTPEETLLGIERDSLIVFDASNARLRNITREYFDVAPERVRSLQELVE